MNHGQSLAPSAVGPVASFAPPGLRIQFGIARPGRWHGRGGGVGAILDQAQILIIAHGLPKLAKYVIVYISCIAAALEKIASMSITKGSVLAGKKIGANRKKNCISIRVRAHIRLIGKPVKDAEGYLQSLFTVFLILRKRTCLWSKSQKRFGSENRLRRNSHLCGHQNADNRLHCKQRWTCAHSVSHRGHQRLRIE